MMYVDTNKTENRFVDCCGENKDVSIIYLNDIEIGYLQGIPNENGFLINILEFKKEYRYKGYGTKLVHNILTVFDYVYCPVTDPVSLRFWRKFKHTEHLMKPSIEYSAFQKEYELNTPVMIFIGNNHKRIEDYLVSKNII